ncbi:MAG TPA: SET domain-containing protein-lysine N-methyltransferase [Candidatus Saccharimonadales bacterium]|nr:SET domain-containing protein-lysine N-methyltransferase [Candidatus Saccharimonadales bacterium]
MSLESWRAPAIERREGGLDGGLGLFAVEDIDENQLLAIRGGRLVTEDVIKANADIINGSHFQLAPNLFSTGLTPEEVDKTLIGYNHSCEPNAYVDGNILLRSMRSIEEGEEITVEYATYFSSDTQEFDCQCGSEHCRGHIKPSLDSTDPEIRDRYDGYFADFLARPEAYAGVQLQPMDPESAVSSWLSTKAERVMDSSIHSLGLLAVDSIQAGELLAVKGGRLMTAGEVKANQGIIQGSEVQITQDMFMAGLNEQERLAALLGFNHRCYEPNAIMRRQISIFALTDIKAGDELTEEYATAFISPTQKFDCRCGAPNCRRQVDTTVDWRRPELQAKLPFVDFIQERIRQEATV